MSLAVLVSGAVSIVCALALVYGVIHLMPRYDGAASVGIGKVFGGLGSLLYAPLAAAVYGVILWRGGRRGAIAIAAVVLMALPAAVLLIGVSRGGGGLMREFQGTLQFIVPLAVIAVVQWLMLHLHLSRQPS